eukprot:148103-Chlamydomonas_euryale.AAC.1
MDTLSPAFTTLTIACAGPTDSKSAGASRAHSRSCAGWHGGQPPPAGPSAPHVRPPAPGQ